MIARRQVGALAVAGLIAFMTIAVATAKKPTTAKPTTTRRMLTWVIPTGWGIADAEERVGLDRGTLLVGPTEMRINILPSAPAAPLNDVLQKIALTYGLTPIAPPAPAARWEGDPLRMAKLVYRTPKGSAGGCYAVQYSDGKAERVQAICAMCGACQVSADFNAFSAAFNGLINSLKVEDVPGGNGTETAPYCVPERTPSKTAPPGNEI